MRRDLGERESYVRRTDENHDRNESLSDAAAGAAGLVARGCRAAEAPSRRRRDALGVRLHRGDRGGAGDLAVLGGEVRRKAQVTCRCRAYGFPHRWLGGACGDSAAERWKDEILDDPRRGLAAEINAEMRRLSKDRNSF